MNSTFFVTPIGSDNSDERKRADNVLKHVLNDALGDMCEITRADKVFSSGSITHDVIERLFESDLVVADLTGLNANVMYEVGLRHSFNLPIIQIAQKGQRLPFDIASERTILFDITDLTEVASAKETIRTTASAVLKNPRSYRGPIDRVLDSQAFYVGGGDLGSTLEAIDEKISRGFERIFDHLGFDPSSGNSPILERIEALEMSVGQMFDEAEQRSYVSPHNYRIEELHRIFSSVGERELIQLVDLIVKKYDTRRSRRKRSIKKN